MPDVQLHPLIAAYVSSDTDLSTILRTLPAGGEPMATALRHLRDFIDGRHSTKEAFRLARDVRIEEADSDLLVLFLGNWAHASWIQASSLRGSLTQARTLAQRAGALITRRTPPELASYVRVVEAHLAGADGDRAKQQALMADALAGLPAASPRRKFIVLELAYLLAQMGRLRELDSELNRLSAQYTDHFRRSWLAVVRFIDHVETGRLDLAGRLVTEIEGFDIDRFFSRTFENYQVLLDLMCAAPDRRHLPDWALAMRSLLGNNAEQSLRWARLCAKDNEDAVAGVGCLSFNLVRAELAAGNGAAAGRLLELRHRRGNAGYLDDLFLARTALLAGREDEAVRHWAALLEAVDTRDATGRLDFELRLAIDMPRDALVRLTRAALRLRASRGESRAAAAPEPAPVPRAEATGLDRLAGISGALAAVREDILRFAPLDVPVLLTGETGTGKELVARALHEAGPRAQHPFIAVNCGAIAESLLESELFGHHKGAFSGATESRRGLFEEAGQGTLLLDEIGDVSARLQVALLRVLETNDIRAVGSSRSRRIACRIVASTNADPAQLAEQGRFRRDLLFRLRRLQIHLLPLRERPEDILPLAAHFLDLGRAHGVHAAMSPGLQALLRRHPWPGNVRELRNTIERMRLMNSDKLYYDVADVRLGEQAAADAPQAAMHRPARAGGPAEAAACPAPGGPAREKDAAAGADEQWIKQGKSRIRRLERLRELFARHETLTRGEVLKALGVSPNTATHDLKSLCAEGFVRKVQPSASPRSAYFAIVRRPDRPAARNEGTRTETDTDNDRIFA